VALLLYLFTKRLLLNRSLLLHKWRNVSSLMAQITQAHGGWAKAVLVRHTRNSPGRMKVNPGRDACDAGLSVFFFPLPIAFVSFSPMVSRKTVFF
jgi:hypothetical protein